jgi:hypothetical protein
LNTKNIKHYRRAIRACATSELDMKDDGKERLDEKTCERLEKLSLSLMRPKFSLVTLYETQECIHEFIFHLPRKKIIVSSSQYLAWKLLIRTRLIAKWRRLMGLIPFAATAAIAQFPVSGVLRPTPFDSHVYQLPT